MSASTKEVQTFTPGPWRMEPYITHGERIYAVFCGGRAQDGVFLGSVGTQPESEGNARLIATAPELLEALKAYRAKFGHCGSVAEQADAAIAKACGESEQANSKEAK